MPVTPISFCTAMPWHTTCCIAKPNMHVRCSVLCSRLVRCYISAEILVHIGLQVSSDRRNWQSITSSQVGDTLPVSSV